MDIGPPFFVELALHGAEAKQDVLMPDSLTSDVTILSIGQYLAFAYQTTFGFCILVNIRISTDILVCLSTAQFEPKSALLTKTSKLYQNLFNKILSRGCKQSTQLELK